jgi:F0F1-type ATP synthase delta subunit
MDPLAPLADDGLSRQKPLTSHLEQRKKSMKIELKVRIDPKLIAKIITLIAVIFA